MVRCSKEMGRGCAVRRRRVLGSAGAGYAHRHRQLESHAWSLGVYRGEKNVWSICWARRLGVEVGNVEEAIRGKAE